MVTPARVACSQTAALALAETGGGVRVWLENLDGSNTIYIGGDNTVTSSNGFPLKPNSTMWFDVSGDEIWAICASGLTASLAVLAVS